MKMNETKNYVSPEVEVVKVSVEKGFQSSLDNIDDQGGVYNPGFGYGE